MLALLKPTLIGVASARVVPRSRSSQPQMRVLRVFTPDDFPSEWPYSEKDLERMDESPDFNFYSQPRFVTHIDDGAISAVTQYYREALPPDADVLDICSSWVSHLAPVAYCRRDLWVAPLACCSNRCCNR